MTSLEEAPIPAAGRGTAAAWLPALLLLFIGSGCAALIYEVVWFQLLQLSIGSSAVSLGVLLGIYMGGMCLGSLLLPRYVTPSQHPLRVYAFLELGIGMFGVVVLYGVPIIGGVYTAWAGSGTASLILRAIVASICLLPPTLLMGGTLPVVARGVEATPNGVSWLGYFYGGNLLGAVTGSLLAGFYLLRVYDMPTATFVAVALNVAVALIALLVASRIEHRPAPLAVAPVRQRGNRLVYVAIALSGMTALGAEVIWTRLLSLLFGATTYTFSLILAVFLAGLGIGSSIGSAIARQFPRSRVPLGVCQMLLCAAIAWAAHTTGASMPYWPINPSIGKSPVYQFDLDLLRAFWVVLPAAILWGASFPLAISAAAREGEDAGRLVGGVYAANTVGAIAGALVTSLILVAAIGSQKSQQVLIVISAVSGLLMLAQGSDADDGATRGVEPRRHRGLTPIVAMIVAGATAGLLVRSVPPLPGILVAYGRYAATWVGINEIIYAGEGVTASVAVSRTPGGVLNYHNAGKVQASSEPQDMRLQRMLGHLTTLVPENPRRVLVIGCG
ncbi:MAG TPA: fused MFS/spermidine synthase, partial [Vicinamibacterales bacterium]|nr:fused MFS/spermidine synthase [Vicinamibacterales bacterium]